ncbi:MAG: protein kinase [Deltaproteobacteria bacterium]|nr:protein kinase [Deltaproteobacteria bacterium]
MDLEPGAVIHGKYKIVSLVGKGGMGCVYEAENVRISRRVAIKVLHAQAAEDASIVIRFEREAQAAGKIGSDHIVEVLDLGDLPNGDRFMVMEFLEGVSLKDRMKASGAMPPETIFPLVIGLLEGLAQAHKAGVIHRDLKPENIFLLDEQKGLVDYVKILDFGISKFRSAALEGMEMTAVGTLMGTPHYMAPEQATGGTSMDHRADLYAVGVLLFKALTTKYPFPAKDICKLIVKLLAEDAPPLSAFLPDADEVVAAIVAKALSRTPETRYQSSEELASDLTIWLQNNGFPTVGFRAPVTGEQSVPIATPASGVASTSSPDWVSDSTSDAAASGGMTGQGPEGLVNFYEEGGPAALAAEPEPIADLSAMGDDLLDLEGTGPVSARGPARPRAAATSGSFGTGSFSTAETGSRPTTGSHSLNDTGSRNHPASGSFDTPNSGITAQPVVGRGRPAKARSSNKVTIALAIFTLVIAAGLTIVLIVRSGRSSDRDQATPPKPTVDNVESAAPAAPPKPKPKASASASSSAEAARAPGRRYRPKKAKPDPTTAASGRKIKTQL